VQLAQCAGRPENGASEPYLSNIGVPLKGSLLKNAYHFLQKNGLGGLYPSCEDCFSVAVVAAEFWSLQIICGFQRTNRVGQTLIVRNKGLAIFVNLLNPRLSYASSAKQRPARPTSCHDNVKIVTWNPSRQQDVFAAQDDVHPVDGLELFWCTSMFRGDLVRAMSTVHQAPRSSLPIRATIAFGIM